MEEETPTTKQRVQYRRGKRTKLPKLVEVFPKKSKGKEKFLHVKSKKESVVPALKELLKKRKLILQQLRFLRKRKCNFFSNVISRQNKF